MRRKSKIAYEIIAHCLFGLICFMSMLFLEGVQPSISAYVHYPITDIIFKTWMIVLALGSLRNRYFKYTSLPLIGLTIFDAAKFGWIGIVHNVFAISFFLIIIIQFLRRKKTLLFGVLSILCIPVLFYSIFWGEVLAITVTYTYFLIKAYKLLDK